MHIQFIYLWYIWGDFHIIFTSKGENLQTRNPKNENPCQNLYYAPEYNLLLKNYTINNKYYYYEYMIDKSMIQTRLSGPKKSTKL